MEGACLHQPPLYTLAWYDWTKNVLWTFKYFKLNDSQSPNCQYDDNRFKIWITKNILSAM